MIRLYSLKNRLIRTWRDVEGNLCEEDVGPAEYVSFSKERLPSVDCKQTHEPNRWWRQVWKDYDDRKHALEVFGEKLFEADVSPVRRFCTDNAVKIERPKRCYLDIETDPRVPFSRKEETTLLSWAVVGEDGREWVDVLSHLTGEAEEALLVRLWTVLEQYDQVCAWNGDGFDFPVIEARTRLYKRQMPTAARRLLFLDQLAAYKRLNTASKSGGEKTSNRLDAVCMEHLGEGKHDFDAKRVYDAWVAGGEERDRMVSYNLQDTRLLKKLEAKLGHLDLFQTMCELTTAFPDSHGLKPTSQVDATLLRKAALRGTHLPSKRERTVEQYRGAFVADIQEAGILRTVHVCDFASLYPSIIRTWNIGHESKGLPGCTSPETGVTFATERETMLAEACREAMDKRKVYKKEQVNHPPGTPAWEEAERKSKAYKVFCNSIYGVMGSPFSRYYDIDIVESVTLTGQWLIKTIASEAEKRGWKQIAGDTDSCFITGCSPSEFQTFVDWTNSDLFPRLLREKSCNPTFACVKLSYEKAFDLLIIPFGIKGKPAAKRYAGSYLLYEGKEATADSKPEIKGLEYMRGDSLQMARTMQRELVGMLLTGDASPQRYIDWVLEWRRRVMFGPLSLDDVAQSKGISRDLKLYKSAPPHVAIARQMEEAGDEVSEGTRIRYVIIDGQKSPMVTLPAEQYTGVVDRHYLWNKLIFPPSLRLLAPCIRNVNWNSFKLTPPKPVSAGQLTLF